MAMSVPSCAANGSMASEGVPAALRDPAAARAPSARFWRRSLLVPWHVVRLVLRLLTRLLHLFSGTVRCGGEPSPAPCAPWRPSARDNKEARANTGVFDCQCSGRGGGGGAWGR